ncbi:phosphotransferase enzyme family protein [Nocardia wallacei]|uniref:phosphotransferase enzyme family protein n=1 Tax=Nocardia wallacei TaxID=480035 RepID=UPI0024538174|nr:aminoglycoside phosphotransferase family protein [Nocardia wallacei]
MIDVSTEQILISACGQVGLRADSASLLRAHSNAVFVIGDRAVARVSRSPEHGIRADTAVTVARWLAQHGLPVTEPLIDRPVHCHGATVTFWRYYPQCDRPRPPARELGRILRRLHETAAPPFHLPRYVPLAGLTQTLAAAPRVLAPADRCWLAEQAAVLVAEYDRLDSVLGVGPVHGDAYPGNTLWHGDTVLLGDWDEASIAPRELDLVNTYQGGIRFGHTENELREFALAYGWDVRAWSGFPILRAMRDLHTLTSYIRRAESGDAAAGTELRHRLRSLRDPGQADPRWHAVA